MAYDPEYHRKYRELHREEISQKAKDLRKKAPEKARESSRRSYQKNRTEILARRAEKRKTDKDKSLEYFRKYRIENWDKVRGYEVRYQERNKDKLWAKFLRRYGLTPDSYAQLLRSQCEACAICGKSETALNWYGVPSLAIDHDHVTGKVRGLLCGACNRGIGQLGDDPSRLRRAIEYLERQPAIQAIARLKAKRGKPTLAYPLS